MKPKIGQSFPLDLIVRCPYCRETIDDEASVCRSCQREVLVLLEALKKNAELQDQISTLTEKVATLEASSPGATVEITKKPSTWILVLMSVISGALSVAAYLRLYWSLEQFQRLEIWQFMLAVLTPPLLAGWLARQAGMREPSLRTEGFSLLMALLTVVGLYYGGGFNRQEWPYLALVGLGIGFVFQIPMIVGRRRPVVVLPLRGAGGFLAALAKNADLLKVILPVILSSLGFKGLDSKS